jgi:histidyl-tRNA synthetase
VERILLAAPERPVAPPAVDLFVARAVGDAGRRAFALAQEARRAGLSAQLELTGRSLKGQLKQADRLKARYVAIIGDEDRISLKDMESGEQSELEPQTVIPTILRGSRLS